MRPGIIKVKVNPSGVAALLRHPGVREDLYARANRIKAAAGHGHTVKVFQGHDRVRAHIKASTKQAQAAEARDRALTRAIQAGR